jgi:hypothetical protein
MVIHLFNTGISEHKFGFYSTVPPVESNLNYYLNLRLQYDIFHCYCLTFNEAISWYTAKSLHSVKDWHNASRLRRMLYILLCILYKFSEGDQFPS